MLKDPITGYYTGPSKTAEERFWPKVNKTDTCWLWTGSLSNTGYGQFQINRKLVLAHRFAYELVHGPIAPGLVIDHLCRIGASGDIVERDVAALCRLAAHKQTSVKVSAFYALGKKRPPYFDLAPLIRRVFDAFGPERLMWASDCPFQVVEQTYRQSIDLVRASLDFLSPADKDWLLHKTAERLFFAGA